MDRVKKIDIHVHATAFKDYMPERPGGKNCSAEELIEFYDKLNIEKGVLLPCASPEKQVSVWSSEEMKFLADQYPDKFLWFCSVDPRAFGNNGTADLSELLMHYKSIGAKGLGELTANLYVDDPKIDNLFKHCAACEMPVTIHIAPGIDDYYGIVDEIGLPRLEKMLKKHPDLIILGHSQPFWAEMSADLTEEWRNEFPTGKVKDGRVAQLMREYGNLYCDLSANSGMNALKRDPEYAARFIEEFSDRLLYGTDICSPRNTHPFEFDAFLDEMLEKKYISEENYRKIVRENAIKLLKLED